MLGPRRMIPGLEAFNLYERYKVPRTVGEAREKSAEDAEPTPHLCLTLPPLAHRRHRGIMALPPKKSMSGSLPP